MLLRMGFVPGRGLGAKNQGILEPIIPEVRRKGQGLQVMQSRIVHDESEDEEERPKGGKAAFGFAKSGENYPDLDELVNELNYMKVSYSKDILNDGDELHIRKQLWELLQDGILSKSKRTYLFSEIEDLRNSIKRIDLEAETIGKFLNVEHDEDLLDKIQIIDFKGLSNDLINDLLMLILARLKPEWENYCSANSDMGSFQSVVDKAVYYSEILIPIKKYYTDPSPSDDNQFPGGKHIIELNLIEGFVLEPIITKLKDFYSNWDVSDQLGLTTFQHLSNSDKLFSPKICEVVINHMITPKLYNYLEEDGDPNQLVPWMGVIPSTLKIKLIDSIIDSYVKYYQNGYGENYDDIVPWFEMSPNIAYPKQVFIEMLKHFVIEYRSLKDGTSSDAEHAELLLDNVSNLLESKAFTQFEESTQLCLGVLENELMIPLLNELKTKLHQLSRDDCFGFWSLWTTLFEKYGLSQLELSDDLLYGWQLIRGIQDGERVVKLDRYFNEDINDVIKRSLRKRVSTTKTLSIKDRTFDEFSRRGILIVPGKSIGLGVRTFHIGKENDDKSIYFQGDNVYYSADGSDFHAIEFEQLCKLV